MPRIRTIKPDFFTSDTVSALPLRARLTWIGLWTHCDDHGRCRDNVKLIKAGVWPLDDVSLRDIESDLDVLEQASVVYRYAVEGKSYIQVTNWSEHQKVDRPSKSAIPAPLNGSAPARQYAREPRGTASDESRETLASPREPASNPRDGKGKEGKGKEGDTRASHTDTPPAPPNTGPEPPSKCPDHLDDPSPPPCGHCADARRTNQQWHADRRARQATAPQCRTHRGQPAHNCAPCRADRLAAEPAA